MITFQGTARHQLRRYALLTLPLAAGVLATDAAAATHGLSSKLLRPDGRAVVIGWPAPGAELSGQAGGQIKLSVRQRSRGRVLVRASITGNGVESSTARPVSSGTLNVKLPAAGHYRLSIRAGKRVASRSLRVVEPVAVQPVPPMPPIVPPLASPAPSPCDTGGAVAGELAGPSSATAGSVVNYSLRNTGAACIGKLIGTLQRLDGGVWVEVAGSSLPTTAEALIVSPGVVQTSASLIPDGSAPGRYRIVTTIQSSPGLAGATELTAEFDVAVA